MAALLARNKCTFGKAIAAKPITAPRAVRMVVRAQQEKQAVAQLAKPAVATAIANAIMAMPAAAEAGKLFDFNLTLPVMAGEFLILMVFLDKFWFSPVGKVLDERDAMIRDKLGSVKDNTGDVDKLAAEAQAILKDARAEVSAMVNAKKTEKQAELDKIYADAKNRIQKEVDSSISAVEKESASMLKALDSQVDKVSSEVLKRVLPDGVRI